MKEKYRHPQFSTKGLVAYYKLYAGLTSTANVFDYSLNGFTGVPTGTDIAPAYPGFAFNGTNDFIDLSSSFQSTFRASYTISVWVKLTDGQPASTEMVCSTNNLSSEDRIRIRVELDGRVLAVMESNNVLVVATSTDVIFTNGQTPWVHLVMTGVADTSINVYANGQIQATGDATALTFADWTSNDNLLLGTLNLGGAPEQFLDGSIGDFRLYNRALSIDEIKSLYELTKWRYPNN